MKLSEEQSRELLAKHDVYVTEACDKCGKLLGHARFTLKDQPGEWCSRECRDGHAVAVQLLDRKGGRPRKYRTDRERRTAKRQQDTTAQRARRERLNVRRNPPVTDSLHVSTEPENQPLAIPIAGERV